MQCVFIYTMKSPIDFNVWGLNNSVSELNCKCKTTHTDYLILGVKAYVEPAISFRRTENREMVNSMP